MSNRFYVKTHADSILVKENWFNYKNKHLFNMKRDTISWLLSDEMSGKWCTLDNYYPSGIWFENENDFVIFKLRWGYE